MNAKFIGDLFVIFLVGFCLFGESQNFAQDKDSIKTEQDTTKTIFG